MQTQEQTFIKDYIRQLKNGKDCYINIQHSRYMFDKIVETYKEMTGLDLDIEYLKDSYIKLKPRKKLTKGSKY